MPGRTAAGLVLVVVAALLGFAAGQWSVRQQVLAPVETVRVVEAGLEFDARLDTGAVVSSINARDIRVIGGGERPSRSDVGKPVSFVLVNGEGERRAVTAPIEQVRGIRTADCREVRYHVYLTIEHRGRRHRVLANLNDRSRSADKLLLGRNWLYHGYVVAPVTESEI
ncbi:MAG: putative ATP-dependent zinc protease [Gammaproteobacteria bacterium]